MGPQFNRHSLSEAIFSGTTVTEVIFAAINRRISIYFVLSAIIARANATRDIRSLGPQHMNYIRLFKSLKRITAAP